MKLLVLFLCFNCSSYLLFITLVISCSAGIRLFFMYYSLEVIELTEESIYDEILLSGKGNKWFIQFTAPV